MAAVELSLLPDSERQQLLITYACLLINDIGKEISAENINNAVLASGTSVEAHLPVVYARLLKKLPLDSLITSLGSPGAAGNNVGTTIQSTENEKTKEVEKKVEEPESEEESDADEGFDLFD